MYESSVLENSPLGIAGLRFSPVITTWNAADGKNVQHVRYSKKFYFEFNKSLFWKISTDFLRKNKKTCFYNRYGTVYFHHGSGWYHHWK